MNTDPRWGTAVHEAGHAVAAYRLGRAIRSLSITPDEDSEGRVRHYLRPAFFSRVEEAGHESSYGGFVNARVRRAVEIDVMYLLAGGLTQMQVLGLESHEVGIGLARLTPDEAANRVVRFGGDVSDWQNEVTTNGDYRNAFHLTELVSSGGDEAGAYLSWLECRTLNLLRSPGFIDDVEGLARVALERQNMSGRKVKEALDGFRQSRWDAALSKSRSKVARQATPHR